MKLLRPHIPIRTQCIVALRQLGEMWPEEVLSSRSNKAVLLDDLLKRLSEMTGAEDLQLDHQPALALREKVFRNGVHIEYRPHSCDPEYLIWRDKHAHRIKTIVRGDGAQFSDLALIRRQKRRERKAAEAKMRNKLSKWRTRREEIKSRWPKRSFQKRRKP